MKKITSILLLVAVFATMLSMTAFAAGANTFTITTDVTEVAAGGTVVVTVDAEGDWADVAQVTAAIKFDADKFSVVTSGRAPWCFDKTWYDSTKDGNPANLGYITTPSVGENPKGQLNVVYLSMDGYTIDDGGDLYAGGSTTVAKIKFTATADVDVIDASCFELVESVCAVESDALHTLTFNQIAADDPEPVTVKGDEIEASATEVVLPKSEGSLNTNTYTNVAVFNATLGADVNYSEAGFIFVKDGAEAKNPYAVDASVIAGGGTFEYGVVMVAIPDGVTISAIPYYVTAE